MAKQQTSTDVFLPAVRVLERYKISQMSLWRWQRDPRLNFPKPMRVSGRRYYRLAELEQFERERVAQRAA